MAGVYGRNTYNGTTLTQSYGVLGETESNALGYGVYGKANTTTGGSTGVGGWANAVNGVGGRFNNDGGGVALWAAGIGGGADKATLRVHNNNTSSGMAAYFTNNSPYATANFSNDGSGDTLYLQANGGRFLYATNASNPFDAKFRLEGDGNAYADGSWNSGGADFAEMLPAVAGLEPGDVLVISPDGTLTRSTQAYQSSNVDT